MRDEQSSTLPAEERVLTLLWDPPRERARGPRPTLTVRDIARTAVVIADADGIDAVSMQQVAGELGVTKMALYRYLSGKSELIAVMVEEAVGDPPDLEAVPGGWRPRISEFTRRLAESWRLHAWLPWVTVGDRVMGPKEVAWIECALSALDGTGLHGNERLDATFMIFGHIRNTQSLSTAGTQPWAPDRQARPTLRRLLAAHADRYPALTDAMAAVTPGPAQEQGREFGLECILRGLDALIAERARDRPGSSKT